MATVALLTRPKWQYHRTRQSVTGWKQELPARLRHRADVRIPVVMNDARACARHVRSRYVDLPRPPKKLRRHLAERPDARQHVLRTHVTVVTPQLTRYFCSAARRSRGRRISLAQDPTHASGKH